MKKYILSFCCSVILLILFSSCSKATTGDIETTLKTNNVIVNFDGANLKSNVYQDEKDFIIEIKNVKTIGQLSINCKGIRAEIDSISVINEDIDSIISDLEVDTVLKDKIASILFSNLTIKQKRIQIRKLKNDKLDNKFIKMFLRLLEYVEQI